MPPSRAASAELALAERAARAAARYLAGAGAPSVLRRARRDLKLDADRAAEKRIVAVLRRGSAYPILAEESAAEELPRRGPCWVVDPLDGTVNYSRGLPLCCVSVALCRDGKPVLGVIHDFNRGEVFSGIVGRGARLNGRAIRVSAASLPSRSTALTGLPSATDFSPKALRRFVRVLRAYHKVRYLGTAALSLAYVAAGRADAYFERDVKVWDTAAGAALVLAAGGAARLTASKKPFAWTVIAGAKALVAQGVY